MIFEPSENLTILCMQYVVWPDRYLHTQQDRGVFVVVIIYVFTREDIKLQKDK